VSLSDLNGEFITTEKYVPKAGDKCLIDGAVAELESYDKDSNVYRAKRGAGRSVDFVTGHISNTRFESLDLIQGQRSAWLDEAIGSTETVADPQPESEEAGAARTTRKSGSDELTTLDGMSK
jgi:hypothetical protein